MRSSLLSLITNLFIINFRSDSSHSKLAFASWKPSGAAVVPQIENKEILQSVPSSLFLSPTANTDNWSKENDDEVESEDRITTETADFDVSDEAQELQVNN